MTDPSQARRRTVSGARWVPASSPPRVVAAPTRSLSASRSMVSSRVVLLVLPTSSPAATARRTRVTRASPRRRSEVRRSRSPSTGLGADSGPSAASRMLLPSTSRVNRYSNVPAPVSRGWDRQMKVFPMSCWSCSTPSRPYFASIAGRSSRHPLGPCCSAMAIRPSRTCGSAPSASSGRSLSASDTTTAADRAGSRPALTACSTGWLMPLPNACASATTVPDPPARVDGAWWRTHWVGVIAADPPEVSPRSSASRVTATRAASPAITSPSTSPSSPDRP